MVGIVLLLGIGVLGTTVRVPLVALGLGPTFNTLGMVDGEPIVSIRTLPTYPTSGNLNMTTVGVIDDLTMFDAVRLWASSDHQLAPRHTVYPPGETPQQVNEENRRQFLDSQANAEAAALDFLRLPTRVVVGAVPDGSPAAGLLAVGDELIEVAGRPLQSIDDLHAALADTRPGQPVSVRVRSDDAAPREVTVTLGTRPDGPQGLLGVSPIARPAADDEITISLADIGGPSAGLIFALAVVDKLTPGELTGGRFIAGTGAIRSDGVVQPIRGIPFKTKAARDAGATVFLVPAENCAEARSTTPDGLELVRVDDLADAVADLEALRDGHSPGGC
ncbi:PDZ domain-containing protein [Pseudonocardia asaccharolytica DSM 44247 = NBRC 16224]|uniref:PDZ domain-containing protein n=1 Tax=Pseudonocardia asaccharolytica DSM 44247 = NBRC 16224 TaxID=1123024 RepID=A0A511D1J4_9PSEU|nr:PDZ domain-containing protein [Pseudonocardia asaccharolytica DSM 44247 = NBRC 16224]